MKYLKIILPLFILISLIACQKDQVEIEEEIQIDPRDEFIGDFQFQTIYMHWSEIEPDTTYYDTINFTGVVRYFDPSDEPNDSNFGADYTTINDKISIVYLPAPGHNLISTSIDASGVIDNVDDFPYFQSGGFNGPDSLSFVIGAGGQGGNYTHTVSGVRIP